MIAGDVLESEEEVSNQTAVTQTSTGTAGPLVCGDVLGGETHSTEGKCETSSDTRKLMLAGDVASKFSDLDDELVLVATGKGNHNGTFGSISPGGTAIGTCEDNLHGLSLTNSERSNDPVEHKQFRSSEKKSERVNPFNATDGMLQHSQQRELSSNFVPLDGFGNDEIMASFIPNELYFMKMNAPEKSKQETSAASSHPLPLCENELSNCSVEINLTHDKAEASDPWVKHTPERTTISPVVRDEPSLEQILPKLESDVSEGRDKDSNTKQNSLYSEGGLKKAPAIESNPHAMVLDIPGPCEPEDLIEGIIFSASYLGSTQLVSNRNPAKNARMFQAQEAVNRIKAPDGESQPTVQVDLFISTSKIKILNADTQETMMSHTLRSISYIADIGDLLVIMAKRPAYNDEGSKDGENIQHKDQQKRHRVICHVLSSIDSHLIAESIGQCFNVAYQQFLHSNCIEPQNLTQDDFNNLLDTQEMYHDDLIHYSKEENVKEIWLEKKKGETMGIAVVESGWGSIIPTVILANMQHGSPVERNGKFSIGDQIMAINGTSMVGLPLQTCHSIIKGLRNQTLVKINIVSCPPVVSVLIKRPNLKHQLGFSVQNGIICSLMRGGIAERGGVRVGHRIIEINDQSIVATPHDKIVQMLVTSVGEIQMKTMPAAMYRLLTGQEQPIFL